MVVDKVHNSVNKITKLEVHKTCDKIGITPPVNGNRNGPDLVQAFKKKWWVEPRFYSSLYILLEKQDKEKCMKQSGEIKLTELHTLEKWLTQTYPVYMYL